MKGISESCIVVRRMVSCLWSCGTLDCEGKPPLPLFPKLAREALKDFDCRRPALCNGDSFCVDVFCTYAGLVGLIAERCGSSSA